MTTPTKNYKKILITTAIDYTNDIIHIGHAYQKILADAVARYYRSKIGENNVYYLTGTDEYGSTSEKAAKERGLTPKEHVDEISAKDREQLDALNISYNRFIRTTDEDHKKTAQEVYLKAFNNGDIYKEKYEGFYCEGCESYKTISELDEKGQCVLHPTKQIQKLEEENYFFKWAKYSEFLLKLLENPEFTLPDGRRREMIAFVKSGLKDIPVSRPKYKVSWGIDVPNDSEQVIYVWFDALINYYTGGKSAGFWDEDTKIIHILGKDNARWHALLWPAMLKSVGLKLPDTIYVHGFINLDGQKISKSLRNVIRPSELIQKYGVDAVRYYLLKHGPIVEDVDISLKHFEEVYNGDLANGLGNTIARVAKLAEKSELGFPVTGSEENFSKLDRHMEKFRVDLALSDIWKIIADLDKHINENEPWKITDMSKLQEVLSYEVSEIRKIAKIIEPFIPETAEKIQKQFGETRIRFEGSLFPRLG